MGKEILKHLTLIITKLLKNPLMFVSESDVHKFVMWELMKIKALGPDNLVNTKCTIGKYKDKKPPSKDKYKTTLIHSEYGHEDIDYARSDIVILNENDVKEITNPLDLKIGNKWIQPDYIFEFGTEKSAGSKDDFKKHIKKDLKKISNSKVKGYLIHIQRNYVKSKDGRLELNKKKFDNYLTEYINVIKKKRYINIKVLVAIVDIGNEDRIVRGKVRLLKDPFGNPYFDPIDQNDIEEDVINLLK